MYFRPSFGCYIPCCKALVCLADLLQIAGPNRTQAKAVKKSKSNKKKEPGFSFSLGFGSERRRKRRSVLFFFCITLCFRLDMLLSVLIPGFGVV